MAAGIAASSVARPVIENVQAANSRTRAQIQRRAEIKRVVPCPSIPRRNLERFVGDLAGENRVCLVNFVPGIAHGIAPQVSAPGVFTAGAVVLLIIVLVLPRWTSHAAWTQRHSYCLFAGALTGAMLASFLGFRGAAREDIVFKLVTNAIALLLLFFLGRKQTAVPHTQEETCPNS